MAASFNRVLTQYGALPYAIDKDGRIRIMLVTSRSRRDWIIPKGWPIPRLSPAETAAREAYEEAGLIGTIMSEEPVGYYRYAKQGAAWRRMLCEVAVFLFAVDRQLAKWPEKAERETRWFTPEQAAARVASGSLADVVQSATRQMQGAV